MSGGFGPFVALGFFSSETGASSTRKRRRGAALDAVLGASLGEGPAAVFPPVFFSDGPSDPTGDKGADAGVGAAFAVFFAFPAFLAGFAFETVSEAEAFGVAALASPDGRCCGAAGTYTGDCVLSFFISSQRAG